MKDRHKFKPERFKKNRYGYKIFSGRGARDLKVWLGGSLSDAEERRLYCRGYQL
jgi:hypothetical protein